MREEKAYYERVIEEKKELDAKLERLNTFLGDPMFLTDRIALEDKALLQMQQYCMGMYSLVLAARIRRFPR